MITLIIFKICAPDYIMNDFAYTYCNSDGAKALMCIQLNIIVLMFVQVYRFTEA